MNLSDENEISEVVGSFSADHTALYTAYRKIIPNELSFFFHKGGLLLKHGILSGIDRVRCILKNLKRFHAEINAQANPNVISIGKLLQHIYMYIVMCFVLSTRIIEC